VFDSPLEPRLPGPRLEQPRSRMFTPSCPTSMLDEKLNGTCLLGGEGQLRQSVSGSEFLLTTL